MKVHSLIITLVLGLASISMQGQHLSSHIEHFFYGPPNHNLKVVLYAMQNTSTPDSLWYETGDGSPPKKIYKTYSIEEKK